MVTMDTIDRLPTPTEPEPSATAPMTSATANAAATNIATTSMTTAARPRRTSCCSKLTLARY